MDATQHLVLDLDEVASIEKGWAGGEGEVGHSLGPGIEGVVGAQGH